MDAQAHFRMLARYNRIANERLYACCSQLNDQEYHKERPGSFGSIHALLNHILLGDWIWMERFEGNTTQTPPLNTILFDDFRGLHLARVDEDARIEVFFDGIGEEFLSRPIQYLNNQGREYTEQAPVAVLHFFNHQAHHRGQIHVMLSHTGLQPPSLDLHRILNP